MNFRYSSARIHEIAQARKVLATGSNVKPEKKGSHGLSFHAFVELLDGPFLDLRFNGTAGVSHDPCSYEAALRLDQRRVRGIGLCSVERKNFRAKDRIPAGWHQNVMDPNQPTNAPAFNRHVTLPDFAPTDFEDFTRKAAALWNIDLAWEGGLL